LFSSVSRLKNAIQQNELVLHYQPKINLLTGAFNGVEALIRWNSSEHGIIYPIHFIPFAEEHGLIEPITEWVLRTACMHTNLWKDLHDQPLQVSVNIPPRQFNNPLLAENLMRIIRDANVDPNIVEFELTETTRTENILEMTAAVRRLKNEGFRFSLDDFGCGYSSIELLNTIPFDYLKIGYCFMKDIQSDNKIRTIVQSMISVAHSLDIKVIAEGVEHEEQLDIIRSCYCDFAQGYYFSKPVDFNSLIAHSLMTHKKKQ